jgi:hypothetical protein
MFLKGLKEIKIQMVIVVSGGDGRQQGCPGYKARSIYSREGRYYGS